MRSRSARQVGEGLRKASKGGSGEWVAVKDKARQQWVGYEATKTETEPIAFRQTGDQLEIILEENPFYAESGGQVSDTGVVQGDGWELMVEGVEKVDNQIEVLPPSPMDDGLRVQLFRAIYQYPSLQKYELGVQKPIRIIVKNGRVTLEGVVDNEGDKNLAGLRANGVPGIFAVTNNLQVVKD